MSDPAPSALDHILEAARATLNAKHAETLERAERVRVALDAYVAAHATEIAGEFATKSGLTAPAAGQSPIGAALALRAAIEALPELRSRAVPAAAPSAPVASQVPSPPVPAAPPSSAPVTLARVAPIEVPEAPPSKPERRSGEIDPRTVALIRDVQSLDLARMPQHQFRIWAEELAARARALQDKAADNDEVPGRVIRKLTAIAYEKGIGDIFGLNRKHSANWDEVAERARVRREAALAGAEKAEKAAAEKAIAAKAAPKVPAPEPSRPKADEAAQAPPSSGSEPKADDEAPASSNGARQEFALLREAAKRGPVVFVGGVVKQEKVQLIQQKYGVDIEWIDTSRHGTQAISALEKRIRDRRLSAVVVLQGLIGHKHFEPLVGAARQVNTPFAYADKAGLGSVSRAFGEIEKQIADTNPARSAM